MKMYIEFLSELEIHKSLFHKRDISSILRFMMIRKENMGLKSELEVGELIQWIKHF